MVRAREIGWTEKANMLWKIAKQIERLQCVWCNVELPQVEPSLTTTTTTYLPCDCDTVLTVGTDGEDVYGYYFENYGSLNPNCENVFWLACVGIDFSYLQLGLISDVCCSEITIEIDGTEYTLLFDASIEGVCYYTMENYISNPFQAEGETCIVRICDTECTTTTTTTEMQQN